MPDFDNDPRYNSKSFIDFEFSDTILSWQDKTKFCQPWQLSDTIPLQLRTNIGPVNFIIRSCKTGQVVNTIQLAQLQQDADEPGMFIYELSAPLNIYQEGCVYFQLSFGDTITLESGEQSFKELHDGSVYAQYKHFENREDIIFETGWLGSIRFHGWVKFLGPRTKSVVAVDQVLDSIALRSQKYRAWQLFVGGVPASGVPDEVIDMLGAIIGCSDLRLDRGAFTAVGKDFEDIEVSTPYTLRGWSIELAERYTKSALTILDDTPITGRLAAMVNSDSKGFGNSTTGSQTVVINVD